MTDDVAEASLRPDAPPPRNKGGRPKSDTITLTKQARDRFNRKVVQNIDTLFDALFDAATKDGDVNAARLSIDRAIPSRRGAPIHFPLRPLKTAQDCADVLTDLPEQRRRRPAYAGRSKPAERHCQQAARAVWHHRASGRDRSVEIAAHRGRRHPTRAVADSPPLRDNLTRFDPRHGTPCVRRLEWTAGRA